MDSLDFLNQNTLRNYPIRDGLGRNSVDGLFTIPNDFIVDLSVSAPNNDNLKLYISKIVNTSTSINVEISADGLGPVGTFNIDAANAEENDDYTLTASTGFPGAVGTLTIGVLDSISVMPSGEFSFAMDNTELLMRVYTPATSGVNYISFKDSKGNQVTLTGYVNILAESNLQFRNGGDGTTVFVDAGENLGLDKACSEADTAKPIKTINGIGPDENGNFQFIEGSCVRIDTADYGLVFNDSCGKPCLSCSEIGTLTDRLSSVESDLLKLNSYVTNLQTVLTQLSTIVSYQCERE